VLLFALKKDANNNLTPSQ